MLKERPLVLISYILLAFFAYRDCFNIFIPGDNYSLFYIFETEGLKGAIHNLGSCFLSLPVVYLFYKIFGDLSFLWISLSLVIHGIIAFLAYCCINKSLAFLLGKKMNVPALFSGLLFLIAPYQTEAVIWTPVVLPLLISTFLFLGCLITFLNYLESNRKYWLYSLHTLFLLAAFSYESSFVLPGICFLIYFLYRSMQKTTLSFRQFTLRILLPQTGIIFLCFAATKIMSGEWIWHGDEFGWSFSFSILVGNMLKYLAKFFLFFRYLPLESIEETLRNLFNDPIYLLLFSLLFFALSALLFIVFIKKSRTEGGILLVLFLCFIVSLVPVLPLDSSFLNNIYPDRYGYLPSVFFYSFLASAIYFLLKKIAVPALIACSLLCCVLLTQTISIWTSVNEHCHKLAENYKPFQKYDRVYVLNVPTYYKGAAAYRSAFTETIFMKNNSSAEKIHVISGCYQASESDTVISVVIKENSVTVSGPKKKTPYFSTRGGWAKSYETDEYTVAFDPTGCSYTLHFKQQFPANSAFIYTSLSSWKKAG